MRHSNTMVFKGFAREVLMRAYMRWIDPVEYCNDEYYPKDCLYLKHEKKHLYRGRCPWCNGKESLLMDQKTSNFECEACNETGDLLDIICQLRGDDLEHGIEYLRDVMEGNRNIEYRARKEYKAQQKADKAKYGDKYELMRKMGMAK